MSATLRLSQNHHEIVRGHLFPGDGNEAVALLLCGRRESADRPVLAVREVAVVPYAECSVRTSDRVVWSSAILDRLMTKIWRAGSLHRENSLASRRLRPVFTDRRRVRLGALHFTRRIVSGRQAAWQRCDASGRLNFRARAYGGEIERLCGP